MPAKLKFEEIQNTAKSRGGACLSTDDEYINSNSRLRWRCGKGHEWESTVGIVRHGAWCKRCTNKMPEYDELQARATARNGSCLSAPEDYVNSRSKLTWQCAEGHVWAANWASVRKGAWCAECAGITKPKFSQFVDAASRRGGLCLSAPEDYINRSTKLKWKCTAGHEWSASWTHIQGGKWCPICAGNRRTAFDTIVAKATERGGVCLSDPGEYKNSYSRLRWQCGNGHAPWETQWANVRDGYWCPACTNKAEGLVRRFLEVTMEMDLPSARPVWLKTETTPRGFILDGYNAEQAVAFEYHGQQHYEDVPVFHRGNRSLARQQARDAAVRELCAANGVKLLEIQHLPTPIVVADLVAHCLPFAESVIGEVPQERIDAFLSEPIGIGSLRKMQVFVQKKGGQCLATQYLGAANYYPFRCAKGHEWKASWHSIQKGTWCAVCSRRVKPTLLQLQAKAESRGGQCLAAEGEYKSNKIPIGWRCAHGHEFRANWNNVSNGIWCPYCRGRKQQAPDSATIAAVNPSAKGATTQDSRGPVLQRA